ncbi:MAG: ROK family protein [Acetatifactor sp.]|nr:ROK family protein [Acetatifactor sp.]
METYLGLDFGGTKLLIGEMDSEGNILNQKRYDTGALTQKQAASRLVSCAEDYLKTRNFVGTPCYAGVGIMGIVDEENGIWKTLNHVEFSELSLAQKLTQVLGIQTVLDNDVKSATMAELVFGAGKISDNFIYVNIGTGLAAGIIANGRMVRGSNNNAGEVGHMVVDRKSKIPCICGRNGCVEGLVSGMGIDATARRMAENIPTELKIPDNGKRVDAGEVFKLADKGDILCSQLAEEFFEELKNFLMNLVRTLDPDMIVLGGGVVSDDWIVNHLQRELNCPTLSGLKYGIKKSELDPTQIGLIGAATHAMMRKRGITI